jgi:hypothetical protein
VASGEDDRFKRLVKFEDLRETGALVDRQFNIKRRGRSGPLTTELDAVDREADVPKPCDVTAALFT